MQNFTLNKNRVFSILPLVKTAKKKPEVSPCASIESGPVMADLTTTIVHIYGSKLLINDVTSGAIF